MFVYILIGAPLVPLTGVVKIQVPYSCLDSRHNHDTAINTIIYALLFGLKLYGYHKEALLNTLKAYFTCSTLMDLLKI